MHARVQALFAHKHTHIHCANLRRPLGCVYNVSSVFQTVNADVGAGQGAISIDNYTAFYGRK